MEDIAMFQYHRQYASGLFRMLATFLKSDLAWHARRSRWELKRIDYFSLTCRLLDIDICAGKELTKAQPL